MSYEMKDGCSRFLACEMWQVGLDPYLSTEVLKTFEQSEKDMSDDSESGQEGENSHKYLKNSNRLHYFKSKNGNPTLSITTGHLRFLTPIESDQDQLYQPYFITFSLDKECSIILYSCYIKRNCTMIVCMNLHDVQYKIR